MKIKLWPNIAYFEDLIFGKRHITNNIRIPVPWYQQLHEWLPLKIISWRNNYTTLCYTMNSLSIRNITNLYITVLFIYNKIIVFTNSNWNVKQWFLHHSWSSFLVTAMCMCLCDKTIWKCIICKLTEMKWQVDSENMVSKHIILDSIYSYKYTI